MAQLEQKMEYAEWASCGLADLVHYHWPAQVAVMKKNELKMIIICFEKNIRSCSSSAAEQTRPLSKYYLHGLLLAGFVWYLPHGRSKPLDINRKRSRLSSFAFFFKNSSRVGGGNGEDELTYERRLTFCLSLAWRTTGQFRAPRQGPQVTPGSGRVAVSCANKAQGRRPGCVQLIPEQPSSPKLTH